jgi:hypothetical protein
MIINDEILAAYVDGMLSPSQTEEVRRYLASHPQEMEQMVKLMDTFPRETKDEEEGMLQATLCNLQNSNIASSGAAFVVKNISPTTHPKIRKANIQANLTHLLNEII